LTESKQHTDELAGQGASTAICRWPLFGQNVRFVLIKAW